MLKRSDYAHDAAGQHEVEREIAAARVVLLYVAEGVEAGAGHRYGDEQAEEQAQRVHLKGNTNGVAPRGNSAAHPVGDDLPVYHNALYKR